MIDGNVFKLTFLWTQKINVIAPPTPGEFNFQKEYKTSALSSLFEQLHKEGWCNYL